MSPTGPVAPASVELFPISTQLLAVPTAKELPRGDLSFAAGSCSPLASPALVPCLMQQSMQQLLKCRSNRVFSLVCRQKDEYVPYAQGRGLENREDAMINTLQLG